MKSFSFLTPFLTQALNFSNNFFVCLFFEHFFELCLLECKHGQYLDLFLRKDFELTIMNREEGIEIAEVVRNFLHCMISWLQKFSIFLLPSTPRFS